MHDDDGRSCCNSNVFLGSSGINLLYQIVRYDKLAVKDGMQRGLIIIERVEETETLDMP